MKSALTQAAEAVGEAAREVSAGALAYPPVMLDSIMKRVKDECARYFLSLVVKKLAEVEEREQRLREAGGGINQPPPFPKVSPAAMTHLNEYAAVLDQMELEEVESEMEEMDLKEVPMPVFIEKVVPEFKRTRRVSEYDETWIRCASKMFRRAYQRYSAAPPRKAYLALSNWLKEVEYQRKPGAPDEVSEGDKKQIAKWLSEVDSVKAGLNDSIAYFQKLAPKAARGRRLGQKPGSVAWEEKIDVTGLPANYPLEAVHEGFLPFIKVELRFPKAARTNDGSWDEENNTLILNVQDIDFTVNEKVFARALVLLREVLAHELRHVMQTVLRTSIRFRARKKDRAPSEIVPREIGQHAGTPFSPKKLPKRDSEGRNAASKEAYPDANAEERYFLDPVEFYPYLGSVVDDFFGTFGTGMSVETAKDRWLAVVGTRLNSLVTHPPFMAALKKHDKALWRKAAAEGWKMVQRELPAKKTVRAAGPVDVSTLSKTERVHLRQWIKSGAETYPMPGPVLRSLMKRGLVETTMHKFDVQEWQKTVKKLAVARFVSPEVRDAVAASLAAYDATLKA